MLSLCDGLDVTFDDADLAVFLEIAFFAGLIEEGGLRIVSLWEADFLVVLKLDWEVDLLLLALRLLDC